MSQIKKFHVNTQAIQLAVFLGGCSFLVAFFGIASSVQIPLLLVSFPLFVAYLTQGAAVGLGAATLSLISIALYAPRNIAYDIVLNMIFPAILLGQSSIKSMCQKRKIWWYPESLMLHRLVILSIVSVIVLSHTVCSEQTMTEAAQRVIEQLSASGMNSSHLAAIKNFSFVQYSVGINVFTKMLITVLNLHLAHVFAKRFKKNIRPKFDLLNIKLANWEILVPLVSLVMSYLIPSLKFVFRGIFVVGLFAPITSGLSLLHYVYAHKHKRRILIIYYLSLFMMPIHVLLSTAVFGIADGLYPLRSRLKLSSTDDIGSC